MSDKDAGTPRVYIARHGETEWTKNGRYTGVTDLELTENGVQQVLGTGKILVGPDKLIDPSKLAHVFISPRERAQATFNLLFDGAGKESLEKEGKVSTTEELAEWDYGKYEGLLTNEIRARRKEQGLDKEKLWDIWRDGCEDGESAQQVTDRMDSLIEKIHELQGPYMHGEKPADVVLVGGTVEPVSSHGAMNSDQTKFHLQVAHGHLLRAFAKRWLKYSMETPLSMMMEPGGIGILSYQHHNIEEPAFLLGMAFPNS